MIHYRHILLFQRTHIFNLQIEFNFNVEYIDEFTFARYDFK
jgi:hypothetical protein